MCRNGHPVPEDRTGKCAECKRLSSQRRNARYYQRHAYTVLSKQRQRRKEVKADRRLQRVGWL